jgi:acylphosphatase
MTVSERPTDDPDDGVVRAFRVTGRVQGVGFRWWTVRTAEEAGVGGTVRNRADGSVEVKAAGPAGSVERLRAALEHGPATARVEGVEEEEPDPNTNRTSFRVVR